MNHSLKYNTGSEVFLYNTNFLNVFLVSTETDNMYLSSTFHEDAYYGSRADPVFVER